MKYFDSSLQKLKIMVIISMVIIGRKNKVDFVLFYRLSISYTNAVSLALSFSLPRLPHKITFIFSWLFALFAFFPDHFVKFSWLCIDNLYIFLSKYSKIYCFIGQNHCWNKYFLNSITQINLKINIISNKSKLTSHLRLIHAEQSEARKFL